MYTLQGDTEWICMWICQGLSSDHAIRASYFSVIGLIKGFKKEHLDLQNLVRLFSATIFILVHSFEGSLVV